jgi:hypothetical protein
MAADLFLLPSRSGSALLSFPAAEAFRIPYVFPNNPLSLFHGIVIAKYILVKVSKR